ncbi:MAG: hypothetical protein L6Q71_03570, partial [Planctomycetes bacterium]|nr:hypothetical protein [Planctomycetota bacterium]
MVRKTQKLLLAIALVLMASQMLNAAETAPIALPGASGDQAQVFRATEYHIDNTGVSVAGVNISASTFDAAETTFDLELQQDLDTDGNYFVMIRGSRVPDGASIPDNDYVRVTADPFGTGDLNVSSAADVIQLTRRVGDVQWEGVITVVECLCSP